MKSVHYNALIVLSVWSIIEMDFDEEDIYPYSFGMDFGEEDIYPYPHVICKTSPDSEDDEYIISSDVLDIDISVNYLRYSCVCTCLHKYWQKVI